MKRKTFLLSLLLLATTVCRAQGGAFAEAVARYKSAATVTAAATRVRHNRALADDAVSQGTLSMRRPSYVSIVTDGGRESLLMDGGTFTMVQGGKTQTTSSQSNPLFATFRKVLEAILSGGETDPAQLPGVTVGRQDDVLVLTIVPDARRRTMFTSFELRISTATSALLSLRMNERRDTYTEYRFTDFRF